MDWLDFVLPEDDWDLESSASGSSDYGGEGGERIFDEDVAFSDNYAAAMDQELLSTNVPHTSVDATRKVSSFNFLKKFPSFSNEMEMDVAGIGSEPGVGDLQRRGEFPSGQDRLGRAGVFADVVHVAARSSGSGFDFAEPFETFSPSFSHQRGRGFQLKEMANLKCKLLPPTFF